MSSVSSKRHQERARGNNSVHSPMHTHCQPPEETPPQGRHITPLRLPNIAASTPASASPQKPSQLLATHCLQTIRHLQARSLIWQSAHCTCRLQCTTKSSSINFDSNQTTGTKHHDSKPSNQEGNHVACSLDPSTS